MNENVVNLLKRAALAIESEDFDRAEEFFDRALDVDAECAEAYFGLVLCDRCCKNEGELIDLAVPVDNEKNFEFALRFAEGEKKESYSAIPAKIKASAEAKAHVCIKNGEYNIALLRLSDAGLSESDTAELCNLAIFTECFSSLNTDVIKEYFDKVDKLLAGNLTDDMRRVFSDKNEDYLEYIKEAVEQAKRLEREREELKRKEKERAEAAARHKEEQKKRDAEEKIKREEKRKADAEEREKRIQAEKLAARKQTIKTVAVIVSMVVLLVTAMVVYVAVINPSNEYKEGIAAFESGDYETAIRRFERLDDYKDSAEYAKEASYLYAKSLVESKDYEKAMTYYEKASGYPDADEKYVEAHKLYLASKGDYKGIVATYGDTTIRILDGVTVLQGYGMSGLTTVTELYVPKSLVKFDWGAMQGCTGLTDIYYEGTMDEWRAISTAFYWDHETPDYMVHCSDGVLHKGE